MIKSDAAREFDQSIQDAEALLARFDAENHSSGPEGSEMLKRAGLVMAMASWETYVKGRVIEEIDIWLRALDGSAVAKFVRRRLEQDLKRFYNPNSDRTKRLFLDYFEVDVTESWTWANYDPPKAKKALDSLVAKRGSAAHEANTSPHSSAAPDAVKRDDLEKGIRFLRDLVQATDSVSLAK